MKKMTNTPKIIGALARTARETGTRMTRLPTATPSRRDGWIG